MTQHSDLSDPLLNQFVEGVRLRDLLMVALRLHQIVLKGCELGQKLLVEQSQSLLILKDVLAVESYP